MTVVDYLTGVLGYPLWDRGDYSRVYIHDVYTLPLPCMDDPDIAERFRNAVIYYNTRYDKFGVDSLGSFRLGMMPDQDLLDELFKEIREAADQSGKSNKAGQDKNKKMNQGELEHKTNNIAADSKNIDPYGDIKPGDDAGSMRLDILRTDILRLIAILVKWDIPIPSDILLRYVNQSSDEDE